jgi:general secretion pathway protein M|tara:strand:- start:309 stop:836 length:528 start_codon:yes stop_codon:yes gene_type:complete
VLERFREHPLVRRWVARYDELPGRDQQALLVLAIALLLAVLYFAVWKPASDFHDQAEQARDNAAGLLAWMQANRATIQQLAGASDNTGPSVDKPADGRALMGLVTRSAAEAGLTLQRFEPSGENAIRLWLEDVPFASVAAWLEQLRNDHGVVIDQAAMDRDEQPGTVSVRLTLTL